jgi:hypothetical protein
VAFYILPFYLFLCQVVAVALHLPASRLFKPKVAAAFQICDFFVRFSRYGGAVFFDPAGSLLFPGKYLGRDLAEHKISWTDLAVGETQPQWRLVHAQLFLPMPRRGIPAFLSTPFVAA